MQVNITGIRNAAMRFDDKNLIPLVRLGDRKTGKFICVGNSEENRTSADTPLRKLQKLVGKDLAGFETLVRSLEKERQELSTKIKKLEKQESELKQSLARYQSLSTELETKKKEIINKAKEDASNLLKETNREIEKTIRHIKENKAEKKETLKVRKNLETLTQKVARTHEERATAARGAERR